MGWFYYSRRLRQPARLSFLDPNGDRRNGGACAVLFANVTIANSVLCGGERKHRHGLSAWRGHLLRPRLAGGLLHPGQPDRRHQRQRGVWRRVYMYSGTAYNCVIAGNETYGANGDGAGIFIENAEFYNNTIVNNTSHATTRGNGGICIWRSGDASNLTIYNCIVLDNKGKQGATRVTKMWLDKPGRLKVTTPFLKR